MKINITKKKRNIKNGYLKMLENSSVPRVSSTALVRDNQLVIYEYKRSSQLSLYSYIRFFTAVHIYEFHISKIII